MGACCRKEQRGNRTGSKRGVKKAFPASIPVPDPAPVENFPSVNLSVKVTDWNAQNCLSVAHIHSKKLAKSPEESEADVEDEPLPDKFTDVWRTPKRLPKLRLRWSEDGSLQERPANKKTEEAKISHVKVVEMAIPEEKSPTFGAKASMASSASEAISEKSNHSSVKSLVSPVALEGNCFLSPVQKPAGKPRLLRPLFEQREKLLLLQSTCQTMVSRMPSEASTVKGISIPNHYDYGKRRKSLVITRDFLKVELAGAFRLNSYDVLAQANLHLAINCVSYQAARDAEKFLISEFRKRELHHLIWQKRKTALDALQLHIDVLSKSSHPNLLHLVEVLDNPRKDYIFLVYRVEFASSLLSLAPLDESASWEMFKQMISAVDYLHRILKVSCIDIRPNSFLVDTNGCVKMCNFSTFSQQSDAEGSDVFRVVAILFLLLFSSESASVDDYFDELLRVLRTEQIAIPETCSPELRNFFVTTLQKSCDLSVDDLQCDAWAGNFISKL